MNRENQMSRGSSSSAITSAWSPPCGPRSSLPTRSYARRFRTGLDEIAAEGPPGSLNTRNHQRGALWAAHRYKPPNTWHTSWEQRPALSHGHHNSSYPRSTRSGCDLRRSDRSSRFNPRVRMAMANPQTSVLNRFLGDIAAIVKEHNGTKLQDFLQIEPPLPSIYGQMVDELRHFYPSGQSGDAELLRRCESLVPRGKGNSSWTAFPAFMKLYLTFLRDVNLENLLETYNLLKGLLK